MVLKLVAESEQRRERCGAACLGGQILPLAGVRTEGEICIRKRGGYLEEIPEIAHSVLSYDI